MNSSLKKLRKKYIITASVIVFFVILLMIVILNLFMRSAYKNEETMIENIVGQAAVANANQPNKEYFNLSEAEQTENGEDEQHDACVEIVTFHAAPHLEH